jgi:ABC-2 type transport system ATP-binding protein
MKKRTNAIEVTDLRKSYGELEVLKGINLEVERGSLLALLGPNGAGKTTTVRILATLLRFNAGTARSFGYDVVRVADAVRRRVGLTGQFASVDDDLAGVENLILVARLLGYSWADGRAQASDLLQAFGLADAANRQVKHYSGGMRRRLDIAASLIVSPDLLFLDEPTTGLDPRS